MFDPPGFVLDQSTDLGADLGPMKNGVFGFEGWDCSWSSSMTNLCVTCFLLFFALKSDFIGADKGRKWSWLIR